MEGSQNMIPRNRITMASFIVGGVGAVIAGLLCSFFGFTLGEVGFRGYILPVGIISGFLSCFFVSEWYLKFMEDKSWQLGIVFGPLFAGLAGTISGVVTIFSSDLFQAIGSRHLDPQQVFVAVGGSGYWGLSIGGGTGVVVGLISSLIFGAAHALFTRKGS